MQFTFVAEDVSPILVAKHRVLQILINLVKNAKQALRQSSNKNKSLEISVEENSGFIEIRIVDTGVGISKANMANVFKHGFTTKSDGHGFGLHSSAIAARELGGSLSAHSEGVEKGATFTLRLPIEVDLASLNSCQNEEA